MVVPATPRSPFKVVQSQLILEFFVGMLDPPAALRGPHQCFQARGGWLIAEKELCRMLSTFKPLHQQPAGGQRLCSRGQPMRRTDPPGGETAGHLSFRAFPPGHLAEVGSMLLSPDFHA